MTRGLLSPSPLNVGFFRAQPILKHMVSSTHTFFLDEHIVQFSDSVVSNSVTPWTAVYQASLSIANSRILLKVRSIESVMPSSHLILSSPSPAFNLSQHQGLFK